ncbi:TIGR00159 family protein [Candidatus Sumerlaeota bacterium]|nr:TIGR00159 family protein [Candidatus Sumerlaeota bacterium]
MQEIWLILRTTATNPSLLVPAVFDILLVAIPFYIIFALLRESRSFIALYGIITMLALSFILYLVAKIWELQATALIYERFWIIVVLVFLIIFQGELKKGLTDFGKIRILRALFTQERLVVVEVIRAVQAMAEKRIGALIVFERANSLKHYLTTGVMLDSEISAEMIRSVFTPQTPLHDGAMIIRDNRIVAAACILPLTEDPRLSKDLGTRHRAAIGLTEETDAVVVVVSEESGTISVAADGKMERFLQPDDLRKRLEKELNLKDGDQEEAGDV